MRTHLRERGATMRSIRSSGRTRTALVAGPLFALVAACSEITSLEQSNPGSILARDVYAFALPLKT